MRFLMRWYFLVYGKPFPLLRNQPQYCRCPFMFPTVLSKSLVSEQKINWWNKSFAAFLSSDEEVVCKKMRQPHDYSYTFTMTVAILTRQISFNIYSALGHELEKSTLISPVYQQLCLKRGLHIRLSRNWSTICTLDSALHSLLHLHPVHNPWCTQSVACIHNGRQRVGPQSTVRSLYLANFRTIVTSRKYRS